MKKRITSLLLSLGLITGGLALVAAPFPAAATGIDVFQGACSGGSGGSSGTSGAQSGGASSSSSGSGSSGAICGANSSDDFSKIMHNVINTILLVLGMVAVIMIIIGGIRYTTSNGDSAQITSAKNTILYAVVGLVIAILSYAIVNFVISRFGGSS